MDQTAERDKRFRENASQLFQDGPAYLSIYENRGTPARGGCWKGPPNVIPQGEVVCRIEGPAFFFHSVKSSYPLTQNQQTARPAVALPHLIRGRSRVGGEPARDDGSEGTAAQPPSCKSAFGRQRFGGGAPAAGAQKYRKFSLLPLTSVRHPGPGNPFCQGWERWSRVVGIGELWIQIDSAPA